MNRHEQVSLFLIRDSGAGLKRDEGVVLARVDDISSQSGLQQFAQSAANIEDQKRKKILEIKGETEQEIRRTQNEVRAVAIALPPLPPLILGLLVFGTRLRRENLGAT